MEDLLEPNLQKIMFAAQNEYAELNEYLGKNQFSKLVVLVDTNTHENCLPRFLNSLQTTTPIEVVEIEPGEENKTLETCDGLWRALSDLDCDKKTLFLNLGGGVVTDLGGFVAATFKRGISFINVPTTLLAMVDAAVGGKNGINLDSLKNQIGIIKPADIVFIDTQFLHTLPASEMRSGLAEMFKHGLINDPDYWKRLISLQEMVFDDLDELILDSIKIKTKIVSEDPKEENIRKYLNFGHTLGHAIETYFLKHPTKEKLLHGEAVAAGMVLASFISSKTLALPAEKLSEIKDVIFSVFGVVQFEEEDKQKIIELLKYDKKNEGGKINFVLLKDIGEPVIDCQVSNELLLESFAYYAGQQ